MEAVRAWDIASGSRIIEHERGCNPRYLGKLGKIARDALRYDEDTIGQAMTYEESVELAARHIYEAKGDRCGVNYIGWDQEPDEVKNEWRRDVKETIDAYEAARARSTASAE